MASSFTLQQHARTKTMKRFLNWLAGKFAPRKASSHTDLRQAGAHLRQTGAHPKQAAVNNSPAAQQAKPKAAKPAQPEYVDIDPHMDGHIEDLGPGKNVLIRNKYVREDTGTHDTLRILDDSLVDTGEETGLDPYNTGQFDRSRNWDKRFRN